MEYSYNYISNETIALDENISLNYTDAQITNILLGTMLILHISIFIYIFLKKCFNLKF